VSHEDRVFFGNFIGVLAVLVVIAFVFFFLADTVTDDLGTSHEENALMQAKTEENIKPVGEVNVGTAPAAPSAAPVAAAGPRSGEDVYNAHCAACHGTGVAGAPKVGDAAAWAPRAAQGIDTLLSHATNGLNMMPPKGTCAACSEDELKGAIEHMLSKSGQ
jgi:cytochrome c5